MAAIDSAGITDVGKVRKGNEDALFLDNSQMLYVVADGMGGHQAGEVASAIVIETIRDSMESFDAEEDPEADDILDETLSREANHLLSGIKLANERVHKASLETESRKGMGSTLAAVLFSEETLIVANVGDSPVYLIHNGTIEQLSVTHNVITEQTAINPDAAQQIEKRYQDMLTRGMGIEPNVEADICEIQHFAGDILVLSSDGLSNKVSPEEILSVASSQKPEDACQKLVNMANERGGEDNVTVITVKVKNLKRKKSGVWGLLSILLWPFKKIFK
jgi:PPM family protein phosphatase